jgi:hypothetical protein
MDEKIAIIMVVGSLVLGVVTIVRLALDHMSRARTLRTQGEVYNRLIDKFGSSGELLTYLQSEAGQQLLKTPAMMAPNSYARIMNSAQFGAIAVVIGFGILGIGKAFPRTEAADVTFVFGWLGVTIGVALLISAVLSYAMSKKFGLINGGAEQN